MRLLSKTQVRQLILLSPVHFGRLEKDGKFPKRVHLGTDRNSRVGWVETEIQEWLKKRIDERDRPTDNPG